MYNKKWIFVTACLGILFFGMGMTTLGSVLPDLKQRFNMDDIGAGTLFSVLPFGILLGSLLFGPIVDRKGYRLLLALTCFFMGAGFVGIAYASSRFLLTVSTFIFGVGGGAINGATSAVVADISSDKDKGANLSILGIFFALGALGMPSLIGLLENYVNYITLLLVVGSSVAVVGLIYLTVAFPPAKQAGGLPLSKALALLKNPLLLLISFFLFFQSAYEGMVNNWTTTYLTGYLNIEAARALYILSASVAGMTVMRLLLGSVLRNARQTTIWGITFFLMFSGVLLLFVAISFITALIGFVLIGAGLAAGFPIMLGIVGEKFKELSGTAFSIAFTIALLGNMIINYSMGVVAQNYGIRQLIIAVFIVSCIMGVLCMLILRKRKQTK